MAVKARWLLHWRAADMTPHRRASRGWYIIFGPRNVYVELQRHFDREEEHRNRAAIRIARSLNLPLLATGGVNYATQYEREVLDVFTCIRHRRRRSIRRAGC